MTRRLQLFLLTTLASLLLALSALAQDIPNTLSVSASCSGDQVTVHAVVNAHAGINTDWQGWVVARTTVGHCSEWVTISTVQALPDSGQSAAVEVTDVVTPDQSYRYGIRVVTADGEVVAAPASVFFSPDMHFDYVTCGTAPLIRGWLEDGGWAVYITPCPGACWAPIWAINPDEIAPYGGLVGTDLVFELFGEVFGCDGIEGCSMIVHDIQIRALCDDPVAVQKRDWSTIKSMFR